ncbi:MAG: NADH dehydrogenase [Ignavibacteria bacterium RIFOXYB2_FULL_35_12]|nr:MAG: NADH dehydrogenase [Ignavibacteria bacterium GWA2_36_19]OGU62811.1 MAG: NADH dehydrogenase [Ignavibacteria bacterium GWF2_35_20]OGU81698.1 MAG: NADH dehydrogenase [Ignavibacteria bacterium RIFOXYA2_FULL_35_9]OGU87287.1 MAG: NADH dehydrogenase [Ignavibacteria bacterium RIFOXYA12_FULL_35_25]OGU91105.1 MAG: NADH dehydrogenase [Ignavibacteria bacterium RIFOXYC12_FULL_35_11]OGU97523.1 MAG: NADH dehydrogenase [Ignavibacteria bacterium RIFOXYB12_FULL_35_14]OGV00301.1 MAG: NADH dehydrogenase 
MKTVIIIGATGLVGSQLTIKLLNDNRYKLVKIFVRKSSSITYPKLEEHVVDFDKLETWKHEISGDELYSTMGTTIKKAGSKEAQYKIDFTYQYECAKAASENGVGKYLLVSSAGANIKSGNFYLRMKGELDEKISVLPFRQLYIFRPSILAGERKERRRGEEIGISVIKFVADIIPLLRKYRPIEAETVAEAMLKAANMENKTKISIFDLDQIFEV